MPTVVNSSLTYEILMYLNSFYFGMFAVCELGMSAFKAANLPPPPGDEKNNTMKIEFGLLFLLIATEGARIYLGRKGNLTERALPILIGIVLTVPSSLATLYFLFWQNYVLRLELILCSIQLVLLASELVISILCLITMYRPLSPEE
ncbi:transmembrane protein 216-like [Prorops nasuta]|uniref:transmembrane protein 216-like n=1 Tax=Prorops nasuta TaxID=863751 RepID=UPI0034CE23B6